MLPFEVRPSGGYIDCLSGGYIECLSGGYIECLSGAPVATTPRKSETQRAAAAAAAARAEAVNAHTTVPMP